MTVKKVRIDLLDPNPFQVRDKKSMAMSAEAINALAAEMKARGVWESPLRARKKGRRYELCFGHRRLKAMKKLGMRQVQVEVVELDDDEMVIDMAAENFQRHNLTDAEKRKAWVQIKDYEVRVNGANGATDRAAKLLGISSNVATSLNKATNATYSKKPVRGISSAALDAADQLGELAGDGMGELMVETAAKEKMGQSQIQKIRAAIKKQPKAVQKALAKKAVAGKIQTPDDVAKEKRKLDHKKVKQLKDKIDDVPLDLVDVVRQWNADLPEIIEKLELVASQTMYASYIADKAPAQASKFKSNLLRLRDAANKIAKGIIPRLK